MSLKEAFTNYKMSCYKDLDEAVCKGHYECVQHLVENEGAVMTTCTMSLACASGSLETVRYLNEHECPVDRNGSEGGGYYLYQAAYRGYFSIVTYLVEHGHSLFGTGTCEAAAGGGHADILEYAHTNGDELNPEVFNMAVFSGNLRVAMYCYEQGCPMNERIWQMALQSKAKNLEMIRYLFKIRVPIPNERVRENALKYGIMNDWSDANHLVSAWFHM